MNYQYLDQVMRKMLSEKRYKHSLCVADRATILAEIHGCDKNKAYLAGLLHDLCKDIPREEQLKWVKKSDIISDNTICKQPNVWHGIAASIYLPEVLGIEDSEVLSAIKYHTIAKKDMTLLEKVIYVADLTSEDRTHEGVEELRKLSEIDLDAAIRDILIFIIGDLAKRNLLIVKDTYEAYNQYMERYMNY